MFDDLGRDLRLFYLSQIYSFKGELTYRVSFALWSINTFVGIFLSYLFITIMYSLSAGIAGWSYYDMLMLSATTIIISNVVQYVINVYSTGRMLLVGGLDIYLTKPISTLMIFFGGPKSVTSLGGAIGGIVLFAYGASGAGVGLWGIAGFALLFALGSIIFILFMLVMLMSAYKLFRGGGWMNWIMSILGNATKYPLSVYGTIGPLIFTFFIPLGIATYYPVEAATGKIGALQIAALALFSVVVIVTLRKTFYLLFRSYESGMG
ncbi:MAG: ABC-2 family transporter protein [Candidatus Micrarchaeota archaeon]|nr:ABC-2 family transporter protein [Candidatus Micrarchaeota archaeon]MDE1804292.1 ABC-2 family transporter protein [Candidatus Micrarchaeota archaeon]MDE1846857.1 ABC-2 family transporter protein [Candidatus Micrarchaeota archaeon]